MFLSTQKGFDVKSQTLLPGRSSRRLGGGLPEDSRGDDAAPDFSAADQRLCALCALHMRLCAQIDGPLSVFGHAVRGYTITPMAAGAFPGCRRSSGLSGRLIAEHPPALTTPLDGARSHTLWIEGALTRREHSAWSGGVGQMPCL